MGVRANVGMVIIGSKSFVLVELVLGAISELLQVSLRLFGLFYSLRMEIEAFLVNHILKQFLCRFEAVPRPIKHLLAYDFLFLIMKAVKIWMR